MPEFKIPVSWTECGEIIVEAKNLKEAYEYAKNSIDNLPIPEDSRYVDSSYQIDDYELAEIINKN